jgi:predicted TIM-barrel fold metal-dependent hydrolase
MNSTRGKHYRAANQEYKMLSRRRLIGATFASAALLRAGLSLAEERKSATRVDFEVPPGACDCHTHVFGDPAKYPFSPARTYTPPIASPGELARLHRTLGIQRVVIVTPSVYGTDNSCTLWAMGTRGANARGVAVIDEHISEQQLDAMQRAGVRGARLNLTVGPTAAQSAQQQFAALHRRLSSRNWHVQILATPDIVAALKDSVLSSSVPVVFDHFGSARGELGVTQPGFVALLQLVESGKAYVKISGAYRLSAAAPNFEDMGVLARALVSARADRVLWGTDWPHPNSASGLSAQTLSPAIRVDDAHMLNLFAAWVPDQAIRHQVLVDNPARLYDFPT